MSRGRSAAALANQIFLTPAGVDQTATAVRCYTELSRTHRTKMIVRGGLLRKRAKAMASLPHRRDIVAYQVFGRSLWTTVHNGSPDGDDWYDLELHVFLDRLRTSSFRFPSPETLVILQGQRLPLDFYRALRLLGVTVVVFLDPADTVDDTGSTVAELTRLLAVREPHVVPNIDTTGAVHDLVTSFAGGPQRYAGERPTRDGVLPLLVRHLTPRDEALHITDYAELHQASKIGVLVPTVDLLKRLHLDLDALRAPHQWFHHGADVPPDDDIDFRTPGIKILTWASAQGIKFDHVLIPALQTLTEDRLADAIVGVAATARQELVLSYSGQGRPAILAMLPTHLIEERTVRSRSADGAPVHTPLPPSALPTPAPAINRDHRPRTPDDVAREVLRIDRIDPLHRRRVLTAEEEVGFAQLMRGDSVGLDVELHKRFRTTLDDNDERARAFDAFISHNEGLVRSIANRYSAEAFDFEDLCQYGIIGLIRAVEKFDATAGTKFSTYATHWINQSISRAIPDDGLLIRIPVHVHEAIRKVQRTRSALLRRGMRASVAEISARTEIEPAKVVELSRLGAGVLSLDKPAGPDTTTTLGELIGVVDPDSDPDLVFDRESLAQLISSALGVLDARGAEILRLRFGFHDGDEHTLEQIGDRFDVTRERIRQIEKKTKAKLGDILRSMGVTGSATFEPVPTVANRQPRHCPRPTRTRPRAAGLPATVLAKGTRLRARLGSTDTQPDLAVVLTELVGRTISAGARSVSVRLDPGHTPGWIAVIHDGSPFLEQVLRGSLALSSVSDDLRQSDVQLLGSAMRAFDELMVWEGNTFPDQGVVLTNSPGTDLWWLRRQTMPAAPDIAALDTGEKQIAVLQVPRSSMDSAAMTAALATSLGVIYGELLRGKALLIAVDGSHIRGLDPFLWDNTHGQDLGVEVIKAGGLTARVNPRVLPHPDALRDHDRAAVGSPAEWTKTQGFYVRCGGRYLSCAGWFGLPGLNITDDTALARVAIEIDVRERPEWGPEDAPLSPPEPLRPRLVALAQLARRRSEAVITRSQKDMT